MSRSRRFVIQEACDVDADEQQTYRMDLQYDGTGLHGWAKQEDCETVEGSLERALTTVLGRVPALRVAGRTDAGVHARRQVVSLRLPLQVDANGLLLSLNALTPPNISVTALRVADAGFDARRDAVSRTYRYLVQRGGVDSPFLSRFLWRVRSELSIDVLRQAADLVEGRHDFTAFTPTESNHVFFRRRIQRSRWLRWGPERYAFEIRADAFLRHMVRSLVGTMIEIGLGERSLEDLARLLAGASREEAGLTAPARGLFLWDIEYEGGSEAVF